LAETFGGVNALGDAANIAAIRNPLTIEESSILSIESATVRVDLG
jgi:hypothetical protein